MLVFGGRTPSCLALGDCYLLNRKTQMWRKVTTSKKLFSSFGVRHTKLKLSGKVPAQKGYGKSRWALLFTMCKKVSEKSGWEVNGTRLFESFHQKISRSNRTSEKVVLFFLDGTEIRVPFLQSHL